MDFRILGPVEVRVEGQQLPLGGQRQRALLAYLLLHANEVVSGHRLLDELWVEAPGGGLAALQTQVSRLRRVVGDRIVTSGSGYAITVEPGELDLERFRGLLADAAVAGDAAERARRLRAADELWRGRPLGDLDVPFAAGETGALEELRLAALEDRVEADLEVGHNGELVSELSGLVARYPLRERLRGQLILALYRNGRQAEALEAYRATRRMLDEELGLEPSPVLRELEQAILRHDPTLVRAAPVPAVARAQEQVHRPRTLFVVATAVVLGSVAVVTALLTSGGSGPTVAASTPTVTEAVVQTVPAATRHGTRRRARSHVRRKQLVKATVHRAAATTARAPSAPVVAPAAVTHAATKTKTNVGVKTAKTPRPPSKPPPAKPVTIKDTFDSDIVDPTIWHQIATDSNVSIAETGGQLVLTVGAAAARGGAWNQIDVHVGTQCKFPGNYDARVDFSLLEWPSADNVFAGLNAVFAGAAVGRQSRSQGGEMYTGWVAPATNGTVALPDASGSLRIARVDGIETTYIWHAGSWVRLASAYQQGSAVFVLQALSSADPSSTFGGQEAQIAFDNFTITAVDPLCPGGTLPGT